MRTPLVNIAFLSVISLIESIQVFVLVLWLSSLVPHASPLVLQIFPERAALAGPGQYGFWAAVFAGLCLIVQAGTLGMARGKLHDAGLLRRWGLFVVVEAVVTFLLLDAVFTMTVYNGRPQLATYAFYAVLGLAVANKIAWPEVKRTIQGLHATLVEPANAPVLNRVFTGLCAVIVFLLVFIPNPEAALARLFIGEQFHHWDSSVTGPIWAYAKGCVLNIDIISRYGTGLPVFLTYLTKVLGGVSYLNIMKAMIWMGVVYYLLCFFFLRAWFGNLLVAVATVLVAIRVQMFHTGAYPLTFHYPSGTPLRFFFDVFFMAAVLRHLRTGQAAFLWAAATVCGIAMFHLTAEGLYLTLAFYFYLVAQLVTPHARRQIVRNLPALIGYFLWPVIVFAGLLYWIEGSYIFGAEYWKNLGEFMNFFLSGFGVNPITQSLKSHLFLQSLMGFLFPPLYVFTLLVTSSLWFFRKSDHEDILAAVMCVYGLGLYHYYVTLSMWTSYYMNGLPFVFVCGWWINWWVRRLSVETGRRVLTAVVGLSVWALLTNHNFISYPNALNFSRNPMVDPLVAQPLPNNKPYFNHLFYEYPDAYKLPVNSLGESQEHFKFESDFKTDKELIAYFRQETDFSQDVGLIKRLTSPSDRVPILSSFEIMMLMQADRKPFFYYLPIINSRPLWMKNFVVTGMYTTDHLKKTISQIDDAKPAYIFMERILLTPQVPQAYFFDSPGLFELLNHIFNAYEPAEYGKYLVALKRKKSL
jgi:hypothetical protein